MTSVKFPRIAYLYISLIVMYLLTCGLNLFSHNKFAASLNFLCIICWSLTLHMILKPWRKFKKEKKHSDEIHAKAEFERLAQQAKIDRMDFMKVAEMNATKNAK